MDERRTFFRIKNRGEIHAQSQGKEVHIIDLSAHSAALVSDAQLAAKGIIELKINLFSIQIHYEIFKKNREKTIVLFTQEEQINTLLSVLKNLRREIKLQS